LEELFVRLFLACLKGSIVADPARFPRGIAWLASEAHRRGFLLGIYTDRGIKTCQERPGSHGHEKQDAATYAQWVRDTEEFACFF
jgi:alpha-galactosidase